MKLDLVNKVKKLSNEGLTKLVAFVQATVQSSMTELEDQRVQIKVDDFNKEQFNSVLEHIEDTLLNEQPSKRQKTSHEIETIWGELIEDLRQMFKFLELIIKSNKSN